MVAKTKESCALRNLRFTGLAKEISKIAVPTSSFDVVWLGEGMYSSLPTTGRRVAMLKRIRNALKDDGYRICQFFWKREKGFTPSVERPRKLFRLLTWGHIHYEDGDILWKNMEFIHEFSMEQKLRNEFKRGRFKVESSHAPKQLVGGGAILRPTQVGNVPGV